MTRDLLQSNLEEVVQTLKRRFDLQLIFVQTLNNSKLSNKIFGIPKKKIKLIFALCLRISGNPIINYTYNGSILDMFL